MTVKGMLPSTITGYSLCLKTEDAT